MPRAIKHGSRPKRGAALRRTWPGGPSTSLLKTKARGAGAFDVHGPLASWRTLYQDGSSTHIRKEGCAEAAIYHEDGRRWKKKDGAR